MDVEYVYMFFFFKHKTAYEMRISDWSSDVCSSDLPISQQIQPGRSSVMARRCAITGKGVLPGNNVSHANNKSRRRFLPNLQHTPLLSDAMGPMVRLRLTVNALGSHEHNGGLDAAELGRGPRWERRCNDVGVSVVVGAHNKK